MVLSMITSHTLEATVEEEAVDSPSQLNFKPPMDDKVPKVLVTNPYFSVSNAEFKEEKRKI